MDLKLKTSQALGKVGHSIDKHSPEILMAVGVASFIGAIATAVTSTLKCEELVNDHSERLEKVKSVEVGTELKDEKTGEVIVYTQKQKNKVVTLQYGRTVLKFAKLYSPTILLTVLGTTCVLSSFGILKKRNAALAFSLNAVRTAFDEYRGRVVRDLGSASDEHFLYDTVEEVVEKETVDENGKKHKTKEKNMIPTHKGMYDMWVDEIENYTKNSGQMYLSIRSHLLMANILLRSRGKLYFNRAMEEFGLPDTDATEAGIIYDADKPEEARFLQIRGFGTVREARDGSLYLDESTMNEYWKSFRDGTNQNRLIQFENIQDNIRTDAKRLDPSIKVLVGEDMD